MTNQRWISTTAAVVTAGGLAWLAKLGVIAATDGRVTSSGAAAVFFVLGALLLAAGASAPVMRLLRPARRWTTALALASGPLLFGLTFSLLDGAGKGLVGDAGPSWLPDEAGILATAVVWLVIGLALLKGTAHDTAGRRPVTETA